MLLVVTGNESPGPLPLLPLTLPLTRPLPRPRHAPRSLPLVTGNVPPGAPPGGFPVTSVTGNVNAPGFPPEGQFFQR